MMLKMTGFYMCAAVCLLGGILSAGCGTSLPSVRGTVTIDGKPLADAVVRFRPDGNSTGISTASGRTDTAGRYVMQFSETIRGVQPGKYEVAISTWDIANPAGGTPGKAERVPVRYNKKTELQAEVIQGKNVFDWKLEGEITDGKVPTEE